MLLPGEEIVNLHEVEFGYTPEAARLLDLAWACRCRGRPDLFSREQRGGPPKLLKAVADHRLRRAVHGRGIDHAAARREEGRHHTSAFVSQHRIAANVEGDPATQPDGRDGIAGRGDMTARG
jgi:hypothetical protein